MKAEEVYNIAIHLSEKELKRLYTMLDKNVCKHLKVISKPVKKKLISDDDARKYLLKMIFNVEIV